MTSDQSFKCFITVWSKICYFSITLSGHGIPDIHVVLILSVTNIHNTLKLSSTCNYLWGGRFKCFM